MYLKEFKHRINASRLVSSTSTRRSCEHFILRNDLRAAEGASADKCGSTLRSPDYIYGLCAHVRARLKFFFLCPSATLRLHIQAVPHYIMKSRASDLFKCNGQYKCLLALFASNCSQMFCTPLCPTSCSRRHIRCSDFIIERKRGME